MASAIAPSITHDATISFDINPGTLLQFLEARADGRPRLKCLEGSVTLVSPGLTHEIDEDRLSLLILAICLELRIKFSAVRSTTWYLPKGVGDTAYEADAAFYIQSFGATMDEHHPPDLAIEIVVTNPATKALRAGAFLKIPELWVLDIPEHRLTFHHLVTRGKLKGTYRVGSQSRAFPFLTTADVLERLDDPERESGAFHENCREWARRVLVPRIRPANAGV